MLIGAQLLLSLVVGLSVLALVTGVRGIVSPGESVDHLQQFLGATSGTAPTLQEIEMRASFYERAIKPVGATLLKQLGRLAPQKNIEQLQRRLETAGHPGNLTTVDFLGLKILFGAFLGVSTAGLVYAARSDSLLTVVGFGLALGQLGFLLPNYWLTRRGTNRQTEITKALPDALDMMTVCVDAGLGLQGAMQTVCENWNNALVDEFTRVLAEVRLGRSTMDALESMGTRTGVREVSSFVMSLSMAHKLGISIAKILHIQAEQMRIARRQKAEEAARQASIKMLFPLVFLVFPATFAVILGPAVPQLMETLSAF